MKRRRVAPRSSRWAFVLAFLAAGCRAPQLAGVPDEPVRMPAAFSASGNAPAPARWWTAFEDPALDAAVDAALRHNLDLEALRQRVLEAQAIARREGAALFPAVDGFADGRYDRASDGESKAVELGLAASYEIDLFDRIEAAVDAERYLAEASAEDRAAGAITLAAAVVSTFYRLREADLQLALLDDQIAFNEQIGELIQARVLTQELRGVDLVRQRQLTEATREQRIVVDDERRLLEHLLAVLQGRAPGIAPAGGAAREFPRVPALPATGLPIELVRRRPDVRAARRRVEAAASDLSAALRDRYPRLNLGVSLSYDIFERWLATFAAGLIAPLFDGGRREAEADRTRAIRNRLLATYGQAVLVAFREVEDALAREDAQRRRVESLEKQARMADETTDRLRLSYFQGVSNYIDVLAALAAKQSLQRQLLTNRRLLIEARTALYRALAGDFGATEEDEG